MDSFNTSKMRPVTVSVTAIPGLLLAVLALVLAGCATAPERTVPVVDFAVPGKYQEAAATGAADAVAWVATFNDPRLTALVATAQEQNHNLRIAATRVANARLAAIIAGAPQVPSVGGSYGPSRRRSNNERAGGVDHFSTTNHPALFNVSWEADVWGKLRDTAAAALADAQATGDDFRAAQLSLAANTAKAWFDLITARLQRELAEETVASFNQSASLIRDRYDNGLLSSALEVRLSRANADAAGGLLALRREEYDRSARALQSLLGQYPDANLVASPDLPALMAPPPPGLPSELLARRPDILAAERRLAASQKRAERARKDLLPSLSLTASGGRSSDDLDELFDAEFSVWTLAGNLTAPIFQGGRLKAAAESARTDNERAVLQYAQSALQALSEVEQALAAEVYLEERERFLKNAADQSLAAEELAWDQYIKGLAEIITVLESQRRSLNARESYINARNRRLQNRVDLFLSLGGDFTETLP